MRPMPAAMVMAEARQHARRRSIPARRVAATSEAACPASLVRATWPFRRASWQPRLVGCSVRSCEDMWTRRSLSGTRRTRRIAASSAGVVAPAIDAGHDLDARREREHADQEPHRRADDQQVERRRGARDEPHDDLDEQQRGHDRRSEPGARHEHQSEHVGHDRRRSGRTRRQRRSAAPRRSRPAPASGVVPVDPEERDHREVARRAPRRRCCERRSADRRPRRKRSRSGSRRGAPRARPPPTRIAHAEAEREPDQHLARHHQRRRPAVPTRLRRRHDRRDRDGRAAARAPIRTGTGTCDAAEHRRRASPARPGAPAAGRTSRSRRSSITGRTPAAAESGASRSRRSSAASTETSARR